MRLRCVWTICAVPALVAFASAHAAGDVVESTATGLMVKSVQPIAASTGQVFQALVKDVGRWWDPEHTYSGDARNLSIEPRPGGCFCERLPRQGGVAHATVILVMPGQKLRLSGALGPLQEAAVSGTLTWDLVEREGRTEATVTYVVGGYRQGGLQTLAAPIDSVLSLQLQRLKNYVERGTP